MSGEGYLPPPKGFATSAIHTFQEPENNESFAIVAPLTTSTTFKQHSPANPKLYEYSRSGNPSRTILENCLAKLENGKYGLCFASGLGAATAVFSLFNTGDHILLGDDVYGGIHRLFTKVAARMGIEVEIFDTTDLTQVERLYKPNTKLIWVESPTNPLLKVVDLRRVSEIAKKLNVLLAVDNTFLTPYFQRPLDFGADLAVHSLTKYLNGHSDVVMGAVVTNNEKLHDDLKFLQNAMGIVPAPFDCYQVIRSLKTLALRMRQHSLGGLEVAKFLEKHPKVEKVMHPGLPSHPQHELTKSQTNGHSGMLSFYIKNSGLLESEKFLKSLKVFTLAESLGGYESLAELPSVMTHASLPEELRNQLGVNDNLIRLSVGLEDVEDLIEDLRQAFDQI